MKLSLSQAAREYGRSKGTLSKAIKSGRLSAEPLEGGAYAIDPAEMDRVFPKRGTTSERRTNDNPTKSRAKPAGETAALAAEVAALRAERDGLLARLDDVRERARAAEEDRDEWRDQAKRLLLERQPANHPHEREGSQEPTGRRRSGLLRFLWGKGAAKA